MEEQIKELKFYTRMFIATTLLLALCVTIASAEPINMHKAVHCGIFECGWLNKECGIDGYKAVIHALLNRSKIMEDATQGVYGCGNFRPMPPWVYLTGQRYYQDVLHEREAGIDPTKGAQFWGNSIADKEWIKRMEEAGWELTAEIGAHVFYKEVK